VSALLNPLSTKLAEGQKELAKAEETLVLASEVLPDDSEAKQKLHTLTERLWYAQQLTQPITGLPLNAIRVDRNYGEIARLAAYEVNSQTVSPGDMLEVKLYWQPMNRIERDLVTYVHLTDRGANLVGQANGIPGAGQSPTPSWKPGQMIVDSYTIKIDDSLPAPLVLSIETGLFDPKTHQFIKAVDNTGQLISSTIAETKVVPGVWPSVSPIHRAVNADFEGMILLVGYDLVPEPPGVVFYWRSQALMNEDYVVFVHLLDSKGQIVAQMDGEPLWGQYPTSWWSPGDLIIDRRTLPVVAPGNYRLLVGWYRLADGSRLSLAGSSKTSIELGTVNVPQLYGDLEVQ
jgi:hypothetical protein